MDHLALCPRMVILGASVAPPPIASTASRSTGCLRNPKLIRSLFVGFELTSSLQDTDMLSQV
ncbi:hypothetical protein C2845_PM11G05130 [Panicum miliaceum]|uniref:Uncharacterized protein n=1 Tax=Panicum miliaceum TaxID=4540 RepID=A0A3L6RMW0_PANMI|nr:hypothetical protein C2845_PM11G05130 [Panicum miliaceum]